MNADGLVNGRTGVAAAVTLAAVVLGLTSAQTPTMAAATGMSEIAKLAAAGGVDALQQDLDARSPGLRAPGALTQTKGRRVASMKDAFNPKERVLSGGRTRPAPGSNTPAIAYDTGNVTGPSPYTTVGPTALPEGDGVVANLDSLPPTVGSYPISGGGTTPIVVSGGGGGGGGGSGGGGGGSSGGGGDTPGVGSAVPEPATWLSLMIGFFAIAFGLRAGKTRRPVECALR